LHPRYDDFIDAWLNGRYNPLLWTREQIANGAEGTLTLTP
jgi:acyl-homoserine lactone acylase PvdQ